MGGLDRAIIEIELIEKGWVVEDGIFIPPDSLWENKANITNAYDARDLQDILNPQKENK